MAGLNAVAIRLAVELPDLAGNVIRHEVVASKPEWLALEETFPEFSLTSLHAGVSGALQAGSLKITHLYFLAWHAASRCGVTSMGWQEFKARGDTDVDLAGMSQDTATEQDEPHPFPPPPLPASSSS